MQTTYETQDGERFTANDSKDLVRQMAQNSFTEENEGLRHFMEAVAGRSERAAGVTIRSDSIENFVADMIQHGFLKVVPNNA